MGLQQLNTSPFVAAQGQLARVNAENRARREAKQAQRRGRIGGLIGGVAGFAVGGPAGAAQGFGLGSSLATGNTDGVVQSGLGLAAGIQAQDAQTQDAKALTAARAAAQGAPGTPGTFSAQPVAPADVTGPELFHESNLGDAPSTTRFTPGTPAKPANLSGVASALLGAKSEKLQIAGLGLLSDQRKNENAFLLARIASGDKKALAEFKERNANMRFFGGEEGKDRRLGTTEAGKKARQKTGITAKDVRQVKALGVTKRGQDLTVGTAKSGRKLRERISKAGLDLRRELFKEGHKNKQELQRVEHKFKKEIENDRIQVRRDLSADELKARKEQAKDRFETDKELIKLRVARKKETHSVMLSRLLQKEIDKGPLSKTENRAVGLLSRFSERELRRFSRYAKGGSAVPAKVPSAVKESAKKVPLASAKIQAKAFIKANPTKKQAAIDRLKAIYGAGIDISDL